MPKSPQLKFSETDLTFSTGRVPKGISAVIGATKKGPLNSPEILITSFEQFKTIYGDIQPNNDFPLLCKRALERGSALRVVSIKSADAEFALPSSSAQTTGGTAAFTLLPKYPGSIYNALIYTILPPSNGIANRFDLRIELVGDQYSAVELYKNLGIPTIANQTTVAASTYLADVIQNSKLVNVTYFDLSAVAATFNANPFVPLTMNTKTYSGGFDGSALTATNYINALPELNPIDDVMQFAAPDFSGSTFHVAAAAYAQTRKDLVYFAHLSNSLTTESALVAAKDALNIDSSYVAFYAGGLIVADPFTGADKLISEMGDVLGAAALSDENFGEWYSFAGTRRGLITNALGVVNNFGALSNQVGLDLVANHQINLVINRQNRIMIWGNFTGQLADSTLSFLNIRRLNIYMKKVLGPVLLNFIEEPNDIPTWKQIYLSVLPELDNLVSKRALFEYAWQGDQFANTLNDLIINNKAEVQQGKYKVRLFVKEIVSLQEFAIDITLTSSSVSFEDALSLVVA